VVDVVVVEWRFFSNIIKEETITIGEEWSVKAIIKLSDTAASMICEIYADKFVDHSWCTAVPHLIICEWIVFFFFAHTLWQFTIDNWYQTITSTETNNHFVKECGEGETTCRDCMKFNSSSRVHLTYKKLFVFCFFFHLLVFLLSRDWFASSVISLSSKLSL